MRSRALVEHSPISVAIRSPRRKRSKDRATRVSSCGVAGRRMRTSGGKLRGRSRADDPEGIVRAGETIRGSGVLLRGTTDRPADASRITRHGRARRQFDRSNACTHTISMRSILNARLAPMCRSRPDSRIGIQAMDGTRGRRRLLRPNLAISRPRLRIE